MAPTISPEAAAFLTEAAARHTELLDALESNQLADLFNLVADSETEYAVSLGDIAQATHSSAHLLSTACDRSRSLVELAHLSDLLHHQRCDRTVVTSYVSALCRHMRMHNQSEDNQSEIVLGAGCMWHLCSSGRLAEEHVLQVQQQGDPIASVLDQVIMQWRAHEIEMLENQFGARDLGPTIRTALANGFDDDLVRTLLAPDSFTTSDLLGLEAEEIGALYDGLAKATDSPTVWLALFDRFAASSACSGPFLERLSLDLEARDAPLQHIGHLLVHPNCPESVVQTALDRLLRDTALPQLTQDLLLNAIYDCPALNNEHIGQLREGSALLATRWQERIVARRRRSSACIDAISLPTHLQPMVIAALRREPQLSVPEAVLRLSGQ